MRNLEDITCLKCGGYLGVDEMPEVRAIQAEREELEADRSKAWETCQKAVERGMALEAEVAELREELIAQEIEQENEALRDMLQTAWNMSDAEFEEALLEEK